MRAACLQVLAIIVKNQVLCCWGLQCGFREPSPTFHGLSCPYRVMLDSVTHGTFLPNANFCDPLMSWTDLFSSEEYYPAFEHQTGVYILRSPPELDRLGQEVVLASGRRRGHAGGLKVFRTGGRRRPQMGGILAPTSSQLCGLGALH